MKVIKIEKQEASALFNLLMISDDFPLADRKPIEAIADRIAMTFGFEDWIAAYHGINSSPELIEVPQPIYTIVNVDEHTDANGKEIPACRQVWGPEGLVCDCMAYAVQDVCDALNKAAEVVELA